MDVVATERFCHRNLGQHSTTNANRNSVTPVALICATPQSMFFALKLQVSYSLRLWLHKSHVVSITINNKPKSVIKLSLIQHIIRIDPAPSLTLHNPILRPRGASSVELDNHELPTSITLLLMNPQWRLSHHLPHRRRRRHCNRNRSSSTTPRQILGMFSPFRNQHYNNPQTMMSHQSHQ